MKFRIALATLVATTPAFAQPQPAPAPVPDQPVTPPAEPPPQWLPGVTDVTAQEIATPGKLTLTMARAVELAQKTQPSVRQSRANALASHGRVDLARVPLNPTVNVAASVGTGSAIVRPCSFDMTMTCGGFFSLSESTGLSASANWKIYDFGLTAANVRAAQANADVADAGIAVTQLDVRQDVETSFLESLARRRLTIVAEATVKSEAAHLDQARRFVAAQAKDPIEVAQAQSRYSNAQSTLSQAQANEAVALAKLRAAIGWIDPTRAPAVDERWPAPMDQEPQPLADLLALARKYRPEIVQADKAILAANASVDAAHAERRPSLSAGASALWGPGTSDWSPQPTWQANLTLSWQLWDGGRSRADVKIANANLASSIAAREILLVNLTSALEAARAEIVANRANVVASTEAVTAAQAQLKLADARYAQGLGSQIELADAQTAVTTASGNLISAEWQLADAWAALRRALGTPFEN